MVIKFLVVAALPAAVLAAACLPRSHGPEGASVMVVAGDSYGSGVAFRNGRVFVWTNAHVVADLKRVARVTTPEGKPAVRATFAEAAVHRVHAEGGREVGETRYWARVVRYSDRHDLAVLECRGDWPPGSAKFAPKGFVPGVGLEVTHVGSPSGRRGLNTVYKGRVSAVGRLRLNGGPDASGVVCDQLDVTAHGGCSGGGVFGPEGHCVGLNTEYLGPGHTPSSFLMTPTRRLWEFAEESGCLWALDASVKPPLRDDRPALCDDLPEAEFVKAPPAKVK